MDNKDWQDEAGRERTYAKLDNAPRALVGSTGHGSFGIVWRNAPALEARGGYSGPFNTQQEAEERATDLALHYCGNVPAIVRVVNVNRICKHCDSYVTHSNAATCSRLECQQKEAGADIAQQCTCDRPQLRCPIHDEHFAEGEI